MIKSCRDSENLNVHIWKYFLEEFREIYFFYTKDFIPTLVLVFFLVYIPGLMLIK